MLDFSKALSFDQYLEKQHSKYGDIQDKAYNSTNLSQSSKGTLKSLNKTIHAAVFTEGFCPDCIVTIPFIQRMAEENNNLKLHFLPRTGYETFLDDAVGCTAIPTIITFDEDMNPLGAYVEVPKELNERRALLSPEDKKSLIQAYRNGEYNDLIEKNLLDIIM